MRSAEIAVRVKGQVNNFLKVCLETTVIPKWRIHFFSDHNHSSCYWPILTIRRSLHNALIVKWWKPKSRVVFLYKSVFKSLCEAKVKFQPSSLVKLRSSFNITVVLRPDFCYSSSTTAQQEKAVQGNFMQKKKDFRCGRYLLDRTVTLLHH